MSQFVTYSAIGQVIVCRLTMFHVLTISVVSYQISIRAATVVNIKICLIENALYYDNHLTGATVYFYN